MRAQSRHGCLDDRTVSIATQRMVKATPCAPVIALRGGHSPFLLRPSDQAEGIVSVVR